MAVHRAIHLEGVMFQMHRVNSFLIVGIILLITAFLPQAQSIFIPTINTNTVYQNINSSPLIIYATAQNSILKAYISPNNTIFTKTTQSGLNGYNITSTIEIPTKWYYKFNFTTASFVGEYPTSQTSSLILVPQTSISLQAINIYALLPFILGLILGILALCINSWGWFRKSLFLIIAGLLVFLGGMLTIVPAQLAVIHNGAYNITSSSGNMIVNSFNATISQPILSSSWGFVYEIMYWLIMVIFFIMAMIFVLMNKKNKGKLYDR